jgi:hypothetical protein
MENFRDATPRSSLVAKMFWRVTQRKRSVNRGMAELKKS